MKKLPESEQEIMMIIWEYEEPVSRFQVEEKLNVEKNVAPSTILTLLTRLEKKGFIQKVRNGKSNLYVPLVCLLYTSNSQQQSRTFSVISRMCSMRNTKRRQRKMHRN